MAVLSQCIAARRRRRVKGRQGRPAAGRVPLKRRRRRYAQATGAGGQLRPAASCGHVEAFRIILATRPLPARAASVPPGASCAAGWGSLASWHRSRGFDEGSLSGVDRRLWAVPPGAARALSRTATKPAGAVLSLTGNDHYRFRPPGGEDRHDRASVGHPTGRPPGRVGRQPGGPQPPAPRQRAAWSASAPSTTTTRRPSCATACHACSAGQPCGFSARSDLVGAR